MGSSPTSGKKLVVALAFVAAAVSFAAVALAWSRSGEIRVTPLFGGLFVLALGISGYRRLRGAKNAAGQRARD
jgi:hypothetical protein